MASQDITNGVREIFDVANAARAAAPVTEVAAPAQETPAVAPESVAQAAAPTEAAPVAALESPASRPTPKTLTAARHQEILSNERRAFRAELDTANAQLAELQGKLAQAAAVASPETAQPAANETDQDFWDRLVAEGVELHPEVSKFLQTQTKRIGDLEVRLAPAERGYQSLADQQGNAWYDRNMAVLLNKCPGLTYEMAQSQIMSGPDLKGVAAFERVAADFADYQQIFQSHQPVAPVVQAAPAKTPGAAPVPTLDGPSTAAANSKFASGEPDGGFTNARDFASWAMSQQVRH